MKNKNMLRGLRNKFLLMNMASIFLLMMVSFGIIFFMTGSNINRDIDISLSRALSGPENEKAKTDKRPGRQPGEKAPPRPNDPRSFSAVVDENGSVIEVSAVFSESAVYTSAAEEAAKLGKQEGRLKSQNIYWRYKAREEIGGKRIIALMDVTSERTILLDLILTFIAAAVILAGIIYLISLLFANRAIAPVRSAWEKQKQFVADASHELKTPLAAINTNLDVLLSHPGSTVQEERKWLGYIKSEVQRMTKLTNDLLYLARVEQEQQPVFTERIELSYLAESAILAMEAVAFERNISFVYHICPDTAVIGDCAQIQQVIMILLDNALKYTEKNGTVWIDLKKEDTTVVFSVKNTGKGIAEEQMDKIFDRFYRADEARTGENGSYGLGLPIAKAIVENHHGKIYVNSRENEWTQFFVILPSANGYT